MLEYSGRGRGDRRAHAQVVVGLRDRTMGGLAMAMRPNPHAQTQRKGSVASRAAVQRIGVAGGCARGWRRGKRAVGGRRRRGMGGRGVGRRGREGISAPGTRPSRDHERAALRRPPHAERPEPLAAAAFALLPQPEAREALQAPIEECERRREPLHLLGCKLGRGNRHSVLVEGLHQHVDALVQVSLLSQTNLYAADAGVGADQGLQVGVDHAAHCRARRKQFVPWSETTDSRAQQRHRRQWEQDNHAFMILLYRPVHLATTKFEHAWRHYLGDATYWRRYCWRGWDGRRRDFCRPWRGVRTALRETRRRGCSRAHPCWRCGCGAGRMTRR
eukprot:scaffold2231_cov106-Isochrysis_galbana.AAC.3